MQEVEGVLSNGRVSQKLSQPSENKICVFRLTRFLCRFVYHSLHLLCATRGWFWMFPQVIFQPSKRLTFSFASTRQISWLRDGSEQEMKVSHVRKIPSGPLGEVHMVFLFILLESWHRCKIETHQRFTFFISIFIKNHSTGNKVTLNVSRTKSIILENLSIHLSTTCTCIHALHMTHSKSK